MAEPKGFARKVKVLYAEVERAVKDDLCINKILKEDVKKEQ